jgi:hypothetical protein
VNWKVDAALSNQKLPDRERLIKGGDFSCGAEWFFVTARIPHGPNRCRYSPETINAFTISASWKFPFNWPTSYSKSKIRMKSADAEFRVFELDLERPISHRNVPPTV